MREKRRETQVRMEDFRIGESPRRSEDVKEELAADGKVRVPIN